jgi:ribonuclease VapC
MIVVDTSALLAIILREAKGPACATVLHSERDIFVSAGTVTEALIVGSLRNVARQIELLLAELHFDVVPVTLATAKSVGEAYRQWGKGLHPASLNLGDCFAYALAKERDCPLLYVGDDFARTDVKSAL